MGILGTRWEAEFEGHHLAVSRNEMTRGFRLEWDGEEIARRLWSFVGLGELHGSAESEGRHHEIHVALEWAGLGNLNGSCTIKVDNQEIPVRLVR